MTISKRTIAKIYTSLAVCSDIVYLLLYSFYCVFELIFRFIIPPKEKSLDREIILITGAAHGIGQEICRKLSHTGATLVCWDIDKEENERQAKLISCISGCEVKTDHVDVSDKNQVMTAAKRIRREIGNITILINNAGVMPCKEVFLHDENEFRRLFEINVFSHMWTLQEFLPKMIQNNHGHIVTICSAAGLIPVRNLAPYCGSKHAVHGFIESIKDELRHHPNKPNINFTTVYPFSCNTKLLNGIRSHSRFPSLSYVLEPENVALKIVEGIKRNYEHIYMPYIVMFGGTIVKALPYKLQKAGADFLQCYVEPDR